jgi:hypothetical protein
MIQRKRAGTPMPTERIAAPAPNVTEARQNAANNPPDDRRPASCARGARGKRQDAMIGAQHWDLWGKRHNSESKLIPEVLPLVPELPEPDAPPLPALPFAQGCRAAARIKAIPLCLKTGKGPFYRRNTGAVFVCA